MITNESLRDIRGWLLVEQFGDAGARDAYASLISSEPLAKSGEQFLLDAARENSLNGARARMALQHLGGAQ